MKLVADSGSTKTSWRLIKESGKISSFQTSGINPFYLSSDEISKLFREALIPAMEQGTAEQISKVYYYGAGCSTEFNKEKVKSALLNYFVGAEVQVETDMLGAARALCENSEGIACILGTGSNACYYNGAGIGQQLTSYGFMFGDYGSGAHIGKSLIQHWVDDTMPPDIRRNFEARAGNNREQILEGVYRQPFPNRFLASYSKFVFQNISNPFMIDLVKDCFRKFFATQVKSFGRDLPVSAVGSVAFYYHRIFEEVAHENGFRVGKILESPIAALALYHQEERKGQ